MSRALALFSLFEARDTFSPSTSFFCLRPALIAKRIPCGRCRGNNRYSKIRQTARLLSNLLSPLADSESWVVHRLERSNGMTADLHVRLRIQLSIMRVLEPPGQGFGPRRTNMATHFNPLPRGSVRRWPFLRKSKSSTRRPTKGIRQSGSLSSTCLRTTIRTRPCKSRRNSSKRVTRRAARALVHSSAGRRRSMSE